MRIDVTVPGRRSSIQDPALPALTAPVDQLDTVDSGLTSCDTGWWVTQRDECCRCRWSPRRLGGGSGEKEMSHTPAGVKETLQQQDELIRTETENCRSMKVNNRDIILRVYDKQKPSNTSTSSCH